jgi:carboxymethylenebutenolidase
MGLDDRGGQQAGTGVPGILLQAKGVHPRPGIVLLQEIFGLNASMRAIADGFYQRGYDVFAPDLYWRQEPGVQLDPVADRPRAESLMKGLNEAEALDDVAAAVRLLRKLETSSDKVAAVGYCLGGRLAYLCAADNLVDAAVSYYGTGIHRSLELGRKITIPFLMHIAERDHLCDARAQKELSDAFADRNNFSLESHAGVGHAFARPGSPQWQEAAASNANSMTFDFLSKVLGGVGE